ncbi:hypothetical protein PR048_019535 [Dryococelus australis]|uniref:Elongator complex protein 4 n=1 Tax=Dryococelus australis TaxID=614101 RepID=A0ABQ9H3T8_9NEOP|nr:hypothetical protein PR048_019535 [Dryococelus australis]
MGFLAGFSNPAYRDLLDMVQQRITAGSFGVLDAVEKRNVLRLAVLSLGSPLWYSSPTDLQLFLYCLRALLRSAYAICMVTIPSHLFQVTALSFDTILLSSSTYCIHNSVLNSVIKVVQFAL